MDIKQESTGCFSVVFKYNQRLLQNYQNKDWFQKVNNTQVQSCFITLKTSYICGKCESVTSFQYLLALRYEMQSVLTPLSVKLCEHVRNLGMISDSDLNFRSTFLIFPRLSSVISEIYKQMFPAQVRFCKIHVSSFLHV